MSSITRKHKRRVAFKCAKQGIATAQAIAVSAAAPMPVSIDVSSVLPSAG